MPSKQIAPTIPNDPKYMLQLANQALRQLTQCTPTAIQIPILQDTPESRLQASTKALRKLLQVTRTSEMVANLITTTTPQELVFFYHQVLICSPLNSTLLKASSNKNFSFPGLTYELIYKYLSNQPATDKGHMI